MKRVLLIGKGGYIGNSVKQYLSKYSDYVVDAVSSRNHEWEKLDFSTYDVVYNVSGLAHANAKHGSDALYYEVNGKMPVEVAKKAKAEGVKQYINMSSMIVYGDFSMLYENKIITLHTVPSPSTVYGKSKMMAEEGLSDLQSDDFRVAIIRPPLIYGENAKDNFPRLVKFAKNSLIFPNVPNNQSMIYIDNFCELIRLIIENRASGIFYPQEKEYIKTSKLVADIASASGHPIYLVKVFNPFLKMLQKKIGFIHKALGSMTYDKSMSGHFAWNYCVVSYDESIKRLVAKNQEKRELR